MAVKFKGGLILGADSRTTTGAYIANRVTDKLTQVHDKIWCCTYFSEHVAVASFTDVQVDLDLQQTLKR
jgi:20S proteasome subunit beta 1